MQVSLTALREKLRANVCEITFARRRLYAGKLPYRRMLCTLNTNLLESANGRLILNYRKPANPIPYPAEAMGLLPVWDIFMQDWRMVSTEFCQLHKTIQENEFWKYFNEKLLPMSPQDKINFMEL